MEKERQRRSSRWIYILAAVGCAAGLGNLWRFPMLAFENGGGAFIVALIISNILIVYPLMMFETIIGQKFQSGGPKALEQLKKGTGWIMWLPVFTLMFILMYYAPVMAWGIDYLFESFSGLFLLDPANYFMTDILGLTENITVNGGVQMGIFVSLIVTFIIVIISLRKGIDSASKVLKFTATAPFVLLAILVVRGITLPGAGAGLEALFIPQWNMLLDRNLWQEAIGQSFFSASLAFGYFVIVGSYRDSKAEVPKSSAWIILGNLLVSLLSGIAVFSTLGFMATEQGVPVSEAASGGPMLVFAVLPTAMSMMPFFQVGFVVLLFIVVVTLAIDSIFGILEAITGPISDITKNNDKDFSILMAVIAIVFIGAIPITTGAGLYYLDIVDHFIGGYLIMVIGTLMGYVAAWYGPNKIRLMINETSSMKIGKWFNVLIYVIPVVLTVIVATTFIPELYSVVETIVANFRGIESAATSYGDYPTNYVALFGMVPLLTVFLLSIITYHYTKKRIRIKKK